MNSFSIQVHIAASISASVTTFSSRCSDQLRYSGGMQRNSAESEGRLHYVVRGSFHWLLRRSPCGIPTIVAVDRPRLTGSFGVGRLLPFPTLRDVHGFISSVPPWPASSAWPSRCASERPCLHPVRSSYRELSVGNGSDACSQLCLDMVRVLWYVSWQPYWRKFGQDRLRIVLVHCSGEHAASAVESVPVAGWVRRSCSSHSLSTLTQ